MSCNKAREWLSLELDGQLPHDKTISLEKHLERCEECRLYRVDLHLGQRLLLATEPKLSDNFEWRLQLKLNQTLQEVAQQAAMPWDETSWGLKPWLRNFVLSSAVGLAVVLVIAIFVLPTSDSQFEKLTMEPNVTGPVTTDPATSLSINRMPSRPTIFNLPVRTPSSGTIHMTSSQPRSPLIPTQTNTLTPWSSTDLEDLNTIIGLRESNEQLRTLVNQLRVENRLLKRQLDTTTSVTKDQGVEDE